MSPYNRWAFHHVDEIVPAVTVENDADAVAKLERASKSLDASLLGELFLRATRTDAIVILAEGRIAFEWYANGNGPETLHILMSATKSVTGLIARTLAERSMLDLDALVTDYVPEVSDTPYAAASIQHLLDMRADAPLNDADGAAYASATGWEPAETALQMPDSTSSSQRLPANRASTAVRFATFPRTPIFLAGRSNGLPANPLPRS